MQKCWLRPDSFLSRPVPLSYFLSNQPSRALWILGMERRWPTLVRKPIKEPINISSLLTQKHSYRTFQAGAIRGQTSIRYGSEHLSSLLPPSIPLPLSVSHLKSSHRRGFLKTTVVSATSTLNKSLTIRYPRSAVSFPAPVKWPQALLLVSVRGKGGRLGWGVVKSVWK